MERTNQTPSPGAMRAAQIIKRNLGLPPSCEAGMSEIIEAATRAGELSAQVEELRESADHACAEWQKYQRQAGALATALDYCLAQIVQMRDNLDIHSDFIGEHLPDLLGTPEDRRSDDEAWCLPVDLYGAENTARAALRDFEGA